MGYGQGSQSDSLEDLINEEMKKQETCLMKLRLKQVLLIYSYFNMMLLI